MDKASAPGAGDSRFESWAGQPNASTIALQDAKSECANPQARNQVHNELRAETRDRTGDLQIFGLTLSQLSYRGHTGIATIAANPKPANHMHQPELKRNCANTCTSKCLKPEAQTPSKVNKCVPRPGIEPGTFRSSV
jgi:hypothetical protein